MEKRHDHSIKQWVNKTIGYKRVTFINKETNLPEDKLVPIKGRKIGLLMALKRNDGNVGIGWSKCASKDPFDKDMAERIAFGRALLWDWDELQENTPFIINEHLQYFRDRVCKYFKI